MKAIGRIFLITLALIFLFSGCKIKEYTPELPLSFEQSAVVSTGDFSFECEICCNMSKSIVSVKVLSTEAQGLSFSYDGSDLSFAYSDFDYAVDGTAFKNGNAAVIVYDVCHYLATQESPTVSRIESGYKYQGTTAFGDFILIQNDDNTLKSLSFRHTDYVIMFT